MATEERKDWWNEDTHSNIWRNGYPTYWRCEYKGSGLWTLAGGNPWERWWNVFKGNPWHGPRGIIVDAGEDQRPTTSWRDFVHARNEMDAKLKAALLKAKATANPEQAADKELEKLYPIVHGFMTCREGDKKGEFRETASLTLFCEDGMFKVCLSDRESGATLWASSASFQGALDALEATAGKDEPGWRVRKPGGAKGYKGKGK